MEVKETIILRRKSFPSSFLLNEIGKKKNVWKRETTIMITLVKKNSVLLLSFRKET